MSTLRERHAYAHSPLCPSVGSVTSADPVATSLFPSGAVPPSAACSASSPSYASSQKGSLKRALIFISVLWSAAIVGFMYAVHGNRTNPEEDGKTFLRKHPERQFPASQRDTPPVISETPPPSPDSDVPVASDTSADATEDPSGGGKNDEANAPDHGAEGQSLVDRIGADWIRGADAIAVEGIDISSESPDGGERGGIVLHEDAGGDRMVEDWKPSRIHNREAKGGGVPGDSGNAALVEGAESGAESGKNVGGGVPADAAGSSAPVAQFVVTPFQQGQYRLPTLGHARMELFKTFTLPSMILNREDGIAHDGAGHGGFLWIIRTDPNLTQDLRSEMMELLKPYPNFFLITSQEKINKFLVSWMQTSELDEMVAHPEWIWSGDHTLLKETLRSIREGHGDTHVTETRIDADDGLNGQYLRNVRERLRKDFGDVSQQKGTILDADGITLKPDWIFFCAASHMQWFSDEFPRIDYSSERDAILSRLGRFEAEAKEDGYLACITPGLTACVRAGTYGGEKEGLPDMGLGLKKHVKLAYGLNKAAREGTAEEKQTVGCGLNSPTECLVFLGKKPKLIKKEHFATFRWDGGFGTSAIRARAMTSAGMRDIDTSTIKEGGKEKALKVWAHKDVTLSSYEQENFIRQDVNERKQKWDMLKKTFGITPDRIVETRDLLQHNLLGISLEALKGQCRTGHSCKKGAKAKIANVIEQLKAAGLEGQAGGVVELSKNEGEVVAIDGKAEGKSGAEKENDDGSLDRKWRIDIGPKFQQVM